MPTEAPPYRGRPLARRAHLAAMRCRVLRETRDRLELLFPLGREFSLWLRAPGSTDWFEETETRPATDSEMELAR